MDTQRAGAIDKEGNLYFEYTKYTKLIKYLKPDAKKILFIGAGACSEQRYLLENTNANITSVEIDPLVFEVCKNYFGYAPGSRTKEIVMDGRVFLNENNEKYDVIRVDVYNSYRQIPFHLSTKESVEKIKNSLNTDGVVLLNIIGSMEGRNSKFLKSELKTYLGSFKHYYCFFIYPKYPYSMQNVVVFVSDESIDFDSILGENADAGQFRDNYLGEIDLGQEMVLTDDFAPVEIMYFNILE